MKLFYYKKNNNIGNRQSEKIRIKLNPINYSNLSIINHTFFIYIIFTSFFSAIISKYEISLKVSSQYSQIIDINGRIPEEYCIDGGDGKCDWKSFDAFEDDFSIDNNKLNTKNQRITSKYSFKWGNTIELKGLFKDNIYLETIDLSKFDLSLVKDTSEMFRNCISLKNLTFGKYSTNQLMNMTGMFYNCSSLGTLDLSSFDTSNVKFMNELFNGCRSLATLTMTKFNTEKVIKMESMFQNCKSLKTIDLSKFNMASVRQIHNLFYGCTSVTEIKISKFDTFQVSNFANLFYNCRSLKIVALTNIVTSMASDMSYMFYNCSSLTTLTLPFTTERVIKMNSMFEGCSSLATLIFTNFVNTKLIDISRMFYGCEKLTKLDITKFNTLSVKYMNSLFYGCKAFDKLDLSLLNTSNVINMNSLFYGCSSLTSIDLSSFDTSHVIDMGYMFYNCSSLTSINISNFETRQVENIDYLFYNCLSVKSLSLDTFKTLNVISMKSVFQGCSSFELLNLSNFETSKVQYMDGLFYGCNSVIRLDLTNFDVSNVKSMGYMFYKCKSLTSLDLPELSNLVVANSSYMFAECSSLAYIDLFEFNSSFLMFADYMFSGCSSLKELNLFNWDTNSLRTINYMFSRCSSLASLNLSNFYTPNLKSCKGLFYGCSLLDVIDIGKLDTSSVDNMEYMFYGARSLKSLNFYSDNFFNVIYFNTSLVTNMRYMFAYCSQIEALDLSFFDTKKVVDMSFMFNNCSNLTSVNLSSFNIEKVISMENMFANCTNLSYINLEQSYDVYVNNMNNILEKTPLNMVFCIKVSKSVQLYEIIKKSKEGCAVINCDEDYSEKRKKIIINSDKNKCVDFCKSIDKLDYQYDCYDECPINTLLDPNWESQPEKDKFCLPLSLIPVECTMERFLLQLCTMDLYKHKFNNTNEEKEKFINDIRINFPTLRNLIAKVINDEVYTLQIYNETYQFSLLSYKNKEENLTFIDLKGCEKLLKKFHGIEDSEPLILFKIEYKTDDFRIPIVEYTVFTKDGIELNVSLCNEMNFNYYIPSKIITNEEYKFDPLSKYHNEICYQYTTKSKTDIILYDRRKEFNDYNMSLCENNCKYLGYKNNYVECECTVKHYFNKFLGLIEKERENAIFRFHNNQLNLFNFGILNCFQNIFKQDISSNYSSIVYITLLSINMVGQLFFCFKGYNTLYLHAKNLAELNPNNKANKKYKLTLPNKKDKNIITTSHNPPPKIKKQNIKNKPSKKDVKVIPNKLEKKIGIDKSLKSKAESSSNLIDSKTIINKGNDISILNKDNINEKHINSFFELNKDMEINMLSYSEAQKKDKRGCFKVYFSFLKTRQIFLCIIIRDYNSIIVKICFFLYCFGVCLGINTFFFDDKTIQKIYQANGSYNILTHLMNHLIQLIIATVASSIIKTIASLLAFTDINIIEVKENNGIIKEEKLNKASSKITYKSISYFVLSIVSLSLFWIYTGSFCYVFKNTQIFLIINAGISFGGVMILPFLYYFIPAILRTIALQGNNSKCLYKFSQIMQLI